MSHCDFELIAGTANDYRCSRSGCGRVVRGATLPLFASCAVDAPTAAPATDEPKGPGTVLHELLASLGLVEQPGCGCQELASKMNAWGVMGCRANRAEIVGHLRTAMQDVPLRELLRASARLIGRRLWLNPLDPAGSLLDHALTLVRPFEDLLFHLPPGIGDCSWIFSKIAALASARSVAVRVSRSGPPRALDFVRLLPGIDCQGWGLPFDHHRQFVSAAADLASLEPGEYHLFANPHLEAGGKLADLWPRQETRFHYPIETTPAMAARATQILEPQRAERLIGFYCSSGEDNPYQHQWSTDDWLRLIEGSSGMAGEATFVAIGALYDRRTMHVAGELRRRGHQVLECIGTHIGVTVEVLKRLDYFLAYPSGLGILGDVLDVPTLMFYWRDFHDRFIDTYADPANVANGRHLNLLFGSVEQALRTFEERGLPWIK